VYVQIRQLQARLGISEGTLLHLARGAAHDADLLSIDELTDEAAYDLETDLLRLWYNWCAAERATL
jgi:hypothetical protein